MLDLSNVHALRFVIPDGLRNPMLLDQVRLSAPCEVTVTSTADAGAGSLRRALASVCVGGTVTFSEALAGETITLLSGPLTLGRNVTIDGSAVPGLTLSGNNADRVFIVNAGTTATVKHLTITDGYGFLLAGGILNNGCLTLDQVVVTGNTMATDAGDFWQGGGGIYNGDGATLNLVDSSVKDNQAAWSGGGVYGDITITNSTIANNIAPDYAPSTFFIGQFGGGFVPTLTLTNSIITGNQWYVCERFASGTTGNVVSGGDNLVQDDSCSPAASDLVGANAQLGPLADNGGPTQTHALLPGSLAIDAANDALCPSTDQRGIERPQGAHCDIGAYEAP